MSGARAFQGFACVQCIQLTKKRKREAERQDDNYMDDDVVVVDCDGDYIETKQNDSINICPNCGPTGIGLRNWMNLEKTQEGGRIQGLHLITQL